MAVSILPAIPEREHVFFKNPLVQARLILLGTASVSSVYFALVIATHRLKIST